MKPFSGLLSPAETSELIRQGRALIISGTAELLSQLPSGNWIGGTTPYAMTRQGAGQFPDRLFVQSLGLAVARIRAYDREELPGFLYDAPEHGLSVLILPSASDILEDYAQQAPDYPEMYLKPVVGWVAGVPLEQLGRAPALTFDGSTGRHFSDQAVVLHHALEHGQQVDIDIINPFEPGEGPAVRFEQTGFQVESCLVDGQPANFARFIEQQGIDPRWPLVADYCGAMINVSIQKVEADRVQFYAPVFAGVEYRFARPIEHFRERFLAELSEQREEPLFGCNCILNYLHAGLELPARRTGGQPHRRPERPHRLRRDRLAAAQPDRGAGQAGGVRHGITAGPRRRRGRRVRQAVCNPERLSNCLQRAERLCTRSCLPARRVLSAAMAE